MHLFTRLGVSSTVFDDSEFQLLCAKAGFKVASRTMMMKYMPVVQQLEAETIKAEIKGRQLAIIFDSTPIQFDYYGYVVRYIDDTYTIQQRLCRLVPYEKGLDALQLGGSLNQFMQVPFNPHQLNPHQQILTSTLRRILAFKTINASYSSMTGPQPTQPGLTIWSFTRFLAIIDSPFCRCYVTTWTLVV
jgi:hypothetical protein